MAQIWHCCGCAVAVAPIQPLAWELPCAVSVALKKTPPPPPEKEKWEEGRKEGGKKGREEKKGRKEKE